jgi:hypothetical protein
VKQTVVRSLKSEIICAFITADVSDVEIKNCKSHLLLKTENVKDSRSCGKMLSVKLVVRLPATGLYHNRTCIKQVASRSQTCGLHCNLKKANNGTRFHTTTLSAYSSQPSVCSSVLEKLIVRSASRVTCRLLWNHKVHTVFIKARH